MYFLFYLYLVIIISLLIWVSKRGTLYIFSPVIALYLPLAVNDIIPLLLLEHVETIPSNIYSVVVLSVIANILLLFFHKKQLTRKVVVEIPQQVYTFTVKRKILILILILIEIGYGFIIGVTPSLLKGDDVSLLRKTNEIGFGFINAIPQLGLPLLILVYILTKQKRKIIFNGTVCFFSGCVYFIATAARGGIVLFFNIFIIWFNLTKRGLKWFEYWGIYYLLAPIIATFLELLRHGLAPKDLWDKFFSHQLMIYHWNTIPLMSHFSNGNYLWGESYYTALVRIIPRFMWQNKPLQIDYKYKEILGYDVPGGIYTSLPCDLYLNFGLYFIVAYVVFMFLM
ncbi:MAG: hypothetical protein LUI85_04965, partial [Bacteroides sp.]|nr:hypothetical protein [Bacteroides sp.]